MLKLRNLFEIESRHLLDRGGGGGWAPATETNRRCYTKGETMLCSKQASQCRPRIPIIFAVILGPSSVKHTFSRMRSVDSPKEDGGGATDPTLTRIPALGFIVFLSFSVVSPPNATVSSPLLHLRLAPKGTEHGHVHTKQSSSKSGASGKNSNNSSDDLNLQFSAAFNTANPPLRRCKCI